MAMAADVSDKINGLIAQEYTFVQELVWLPPRRNPFPRCTEKIISDLSKLKGLCKGQPTSSHNNRTEGRNIPTGSQKALDHVFSVISKNADDLTRLRRSLFEHLYSSQAPSSVHEFELQAETLIMQHLENAWGSCKNGSVETWANKVKAVDFQNLEGALQNLLTSFFGPLLDRRECQRQCGEMRYLPEKSQIDETKEAASSSNGSGEEFEDDEGCELDTVAGKRQILPLRVVCNSKVSEVTYEHRSEATSISGRGTLFAKLEMTMKATICTNHLSVSEQQCWHIIFGIVNHDRCKVAVQSLTYWSLDNESEISTIKWPKGGIILKEAPSFLCYSCQIQCAGPESPRVAFNWKYSRTVSNLQLVRKRSIHEETKKAVQETSWWWPRTYGNVLLRRNVCPEMDVQNDLRGPSKRFCSESDESFWKRVAKFFYGRVVAR